MTKSNELNLNIQKAGNSCNRSGGYQDLSHDPATIEGSFESGRFFTRLTENAQIIGSCFSNSPEFAHRLKLEEIEKAQDHVRASRLFTTLPDKEKQDLLAAIEDQIHHPVFQTLPISNHEVAEIHQALFWEALKRDVKDPNTYKTRAAGIGIGLFLSSICPVAAVALFVGGSGYWIYEAIRRRREDARLVEEGQRTRDISLVFQGGQLWADGASSDVFDSGTALTVVGMTKFLSKIIHTRYLKFLNGVNPRIEKGPLPISANDNAIPRDIISITRPRAPRIPASAQGTPVPQSPFTGNSGPVQGIVAYLSEGNTALKVQPTASPVPELPQVQPTPTLPEPSPTPNAPGSATRILTGLMEFLRPRDLPKMPLIPLLAPKWDYAENRLKTITEVQLEELKERAFKSSTSSPNAIRASGSGATEKLSNSEGNAPSKLSDEMKEGPAEPHKEDLVGWFPRIDEVKRNGTEKIPQAEDLLGHPYGRHLDYVLVMKKLGEEFTLEDVNGHLHNFVKIDRMLSFDELRDLGDYSLFSLNTVRGERHSVYVSGHPLVKIPRDPISNETTFVFGSILKFRLSIKIAESLGIIDKSGKRTFFPDAFLIKLKESSNDAPKEKGPSLEGNIEGNRGPLSIAPIGLGVGLATVLYSNSALAAEKTSSLSMEDTLFVGALVAVGAVGIWGVKKVFDYFSKPKIETHHKTKLSPSARPISSEAEAPPIPPTDGQGSLPSASLRTGPSVLLRAGEGGGIGYVNINEDREAPGIPLLEGIGGNENGGPEGRKVVLIRMRGGEYRVISNEDQARLQFRIDRIYRRLDELNLVLEFEPNSNDTQTARYRLIHCRRNLEHELAPLMNRHLAYHQDFPLISEEGVALSLEYARLKAAHPQRKIYEDLKKEISEDELNIDRLKNLHWQAVQEGYEKQAVKFTKELASLDDRIKEKRTKLVQISKELQAFQPFDLIAEMRAFIIEKFPQDTNSPETWKEEIAELERILKASDEKSGDKIVELIAQLGETGTPSIELRAKVATVLHWVKEGRNFDLADLFDAKERATTFEVNLPQVKKIVDHLLLELCPTFKLLKRSMEEQAFLGIEVTMMEVRLVDLVRENGSLSPASLERFYLYAKGKLAVQLPDLGPRISPPEFKRISEEFDRIDETAFRMAFQRALEKAGKE